MSKSAHSPSFEDSIRCIASELGFEVVSVSPDGYSVTWDDEGTPVTEPTHEFLRGIADLMAAAHEEAV